MGSVGRMRSTGHMGDTRVKRYCPSCLKMLSPLDTCLRETPRLRLGLRVVMNGSSHGEYGRIRGSLSARRRWGLSFSRGECPGYGCIAPSARIPQRPFFGPAEFRFRMGKLRGRRRRRRFCLRACYSGAVRGVGTTLCPSPLRRKGLSPPLFYRGRRAATPGPARTRERAARGPGRRARPGAQKKRGDPGVRRGPYAKVAARNAELLERIRELKAEHPFWGYRRI